MQWVAAEQLLEDLDDDGDRYIRPGLVASMATFEPADREGPCRCESCHPLPKRKRRSPAPAGTTIPISDLADVLTVLRPKLINTARRQLQIRGLDELIAEDLVGDAIVCWLEVAPEYRGQAQLYGWLRKAITWSAADGLRPRDLLEHCSVSLDEPWTRTE